ncbi:ATP synthase B chain [Mycoplasmopsis californica HAZ160_1]|uniref:ATP synthase subunit b n=1 Tax=Mycoplasmopsis californica HAZ160_1 TaxID=1397850 RepID=A0AAT9F808_9BACT|nr:F0F1 ATP synthase subunit B [Mycoplasmopsis californica]BAP00964.1 ATP synthase B chain [Mycoplasmopsis californica HAZ160_1]BBG40828.1 ATP synthase B chain [Mycoplasmopsis californica]BBG41422.1 ATP synthase B chain [Mycoplasmopsis californica]BBG42015.1 ATP synthase B chain [Mycoplasmopsis californica]BBG42599.1 ATP synthase B chain [Mycoplasmopsis californica]
MVHLNFIAKPVKLSGISTGIEEKIQQIYPAWPMMIATLVALVIVMVILWFLLYKPVKKAILDRQEYIQNNINQAEQARKSSQALLDQANEKLQSAQEQAQGVINAARSRGDKVLENYINKGKREAERIIKAAKTDIKLQKQALQEQNKAQIAAAASALSRKILAEHASEEIEHKIIDEFLKGA